MKSGFGILEVLIAAVVLGFMIVGVNALQIGNRESILRVRARDAANSIAQETIDSLTALGSAMVNVGDFTCDSDNKADDNLCKTRSFEGMAGNVTMDYNVTVNVRPAPANSPQVVREETAYLEALRNNNTPFDLSLEHILAKQIDVTVSWRFKSSDQSINVSTVIR